MSLRLIQRSARLGKGFRGCPHGFSPPPKAMGAPLFSLLGSVPGTRQGPRLLRRPGLATARGDFTGGPGPGSAPPGQPKVGKFGTGAARGAVHVLWAQLSWGPLRRAAGVAGRLGQAGNLMVVKAETEGAGGAAMPKGRGELLGAGARVGGGAGSLGRLSHPRDRTHGPAGKWRADRQRRQLIQRVGMRRCGAPAACW